MANAHRTTEEILELFRARQAKIGKTLGAQRFHKKTGIKPSEVKHYWPGHSALIREAGSLPNEFGRRALTW